MLVRYQRIDIFMVCQSRLAKVVSDRGEIYRHQQSGELWNHHTPHAEVRRKILYTSEIILSHLEFMLSRICVMLLQILLATAFWKSKIINRMVLVLVGCVHSAHSHTARTWCQIELILTSQQECSVELCSHHTPFSLSGWWNLKVNLLPHIPFTSSWL